VRLSFTSLWLDIDIRVGRDNTEPAPEERGPGCLSADLSVSTSDAADEWTTYEDNTGGRFGFTG
jgi:hypothetical protein